MIALDIPLLYETRLEKPADAVVLVSAPRAAQVSRPNAQESSRPVRFAPAHPSPQWPLAAKIKRADYVLSTRLGIVTKCPVVELPQRIKEKLFLQRKDLCYNQ